MTYCHQKGNIEIKVEQSPIINANPVLSIDKKGCVLYSNEAGNTLLYEWGVKIGEKLPSSIIDIVHKVISLNSPEKIEVKAGSGVYLVVFSPLSEQEYVNISAFDVAGCNQDEEKALQGSDIRFRTLSENSPDIITRFDRQYRYLYANSAAIESYKISLDKIIGKTYGELGVTPKKVKFWEKHLESVFINGRTETLEYYYKSPQGKKYYFDTKIVPEFEDGKVVSVLAISRDITDIKKAEIKLKDTLNNLDKLVKERTAVLEKTYNSLKESERGLAEAQKMAHIGNWNWNLQTNQLYYSDELYRIFGLSPQEFDIPLEEVFTYIHQEDQDYVISSIMEALNGKIFDAIDFRIILDDRTERTIHTQVEVTFDEMNNPVLIRGTAQDITERKKAEEIIERLANIIEYTNDGIGLISPVGIVLEWNKGEEHIYGYEKEDIVGRHISVLAPSHLKNEPMDHVELIKQTRTSYNYVASRMRKDGKTIEVSITLAPVLDSHGKLTAISFITRDITEQKRDEEKLRESEEKYRNIVETANEGIALINSEGIITFINQKMTDMLGYSVEEIVDKTVWDFVKEERKSIVTKKFEGKNEEINYDTFEFELKRKDGSPLWVQINAKAIYDSDGKFSGSLNLHTDITNRKEAEEALANIEIARKKEIHHRIKNNLQVISSLLDLQAEKIKNKKDITKSEILEAFRESQDRVISMALIHEELHKGGGLDSLNFSHYIEELAVNLLLTYRLGYGGISLYTDIEEDIFFDIDSAVPLGIIVNELLSNSLKYAFPNRENGEIQIKLHKEEGKRKAYVLSVADDGIGIPENLNIEDLDSLGLQLVTTLVDQIDGELELKRDNGTKFIIRFSVTGNRDQELTQDQLKITDND